VSVGVAKTPALVRDYDVTVHIVLSELMWNMPVGILYIVDRAFVGAVYIIRDQDACLSIRSANGRNGIPAAVLN
jgi:hypothetical protein